MDTFAEPANVDYRSLFADHGEQTSVFRIYIHTYCTDVHIYILYILLFQTENGSPAIFLNLFTV
jgi:hypothetical protein